MYPIYNNLNTNQLPKWFSNQAVITYIAAFLSVSVFMGHYSMPWYYMLSGIVAVLVFFLGSQRLSKNWSPWRQPNDKTFERNIFLFSFLIRLAWTLLIYTIFQINYGDAFGFDNADTQQYDAWGKEFAEGILQGDFFKAWRDNISYGVDASDLGYAFYVGLIYALTGNSILPVRLLKCVWSALTVVLVYRIGKRNFGEDVGRLAAIFCMLWPNFWYYCGSHLKEVEMVFLATLFVYQTDEMLKSRNFSTWKIIPVLLISAALFTMRTALALVTVLSLLFSIVISSNRVVGWSKRIMIGIIAVGLLVLTMGNSIVEQTTGLVDKVQSDQQKDNMEWRSTRGGDKANKFAKYAGKTVFAPLIFTIPFSTMTSFDDGQNVQKLLNGGNFCKNIISGFTILAMFMLLLSGTWRNHLVPLSFLLGYLVVLALSVFAQSERFHQPCMPMEMMFAAFGIIQAVRGVPVGKIIGSRATYKRWYMYWIVGMFVATIFWNWFKLAGRGLI